MPSKKPTEIKPQEVEEVKKPVVKKASTKTKAEADTGSVDFQVKNFTDKIEVLSKHLKMHQHDFDSRRGLLIMVGKRRRLLNYVKKEDELKYQQLIATLKLKK
jgi:small subunit ribosomal protein S15